MLLMHWLPPGNVILPSSVNIEREKESDRHLVVDIGYSWLNIVNIRGTDSTVGHSIEHLDVMVLKPHGVDNG